MLLLGAGVILFFAVLGALQAFNIRFLDPDTSGETLAFTGLTVVVFLLLMVLLLLLLRNILKLYADQSSIALGSRLRTRMVLGAALIAVTPAVFMFLFSFELMNRSIDRWFSPNITELRQDSTRVVAELAQYVASNARVEAESIAASPAMAAPVPQLNEELQMHRVTLSGGFAVVYDNTAREVTSFQVPSEPSQISITPWLANGEQEQPVTLAAPFTVSLLSAAQRNDQPILAVNGREYALGQASTRTGKVVVVALPMPEGLSQTARRIRSGAANYWHLFRTRNSIRSTFFLMLLLITVVVFFSSVWLALFLSKQITRPVEALADAMDEIAAGKYEHRVELLTTGEMAELVRAFNHMAADLDTSRQLAETSSAQLTAANQSIEERRRELETIVETIPSGVVTLDGSRKILQANRAFASLMGISSEVELRGKTLSAVLPAECIDDVSALLRRAQRMGSSSTEFELNLQGNAMHLALTCVPLEFAEAQKGMVLVVEDTSELLLAQRQLAWKEVAQRVAHEIKNPLTPIALSAERIGRHLDRSQPDSPAIIRKCAEVILGCVGSLRTLVDQFSALAQFPAPQPRACNLNQVAEQALSHFADRLEGITIQRDLDSNLPQVMADPEAMRRALANLIDNAAEAMQSSLLRVLTVRTRLSENGSAVEICVSDTGHGLTNEIRERLFLPFYSTKGRGTGLGLSIAAKIVQEHGGTIRAESNLPKGARFLVRLPMMEQVASDENSSAPAVETRS
ncbi:MAG: HAMP domain-containing protein [Acidobacteriota bacterium]|nr:HAMP domain-containing protein [Acidobacteriota bacterium]